MAVGMRASGCSVIVEKLIDQFGILIKFGRPFDPVPELPMFLAIEDLRTASHPVKQLS